MRPALTAAVAALSAALVVLRARTPGTPAGDADDPHEDNTFDLPNGNPVRRAFKRFARRQLKKILGQVPAVGAPIPAHFSPLAPDWTDPMASAMTPLITAYWDEAGKTTRARLGLDPDAWEVHDPHLHQAIQAQALQFCAETNGTTDLELGEALDKLREELAAGLVEHGEAIPELVDRVKSVFRRLSDYRAEMIARTEASRAVHAASQMSAAESGVVQGKRWLPSANSCDRCLAVAKQVNESHPRGVPLDQPFAQGQSKNEAYASVPHPPLHPHCRCSVTYVLTDEYEELLKLHGPPDPAAFQPGALGPDPAMFELPIRDPKRPTPGEPIGINLPTDEELEKPAAKPKKPKEPPFPKDPDALELVATLGGSTGAKRVRDPKTGQEYVLKRGANAGHLREEAAADTLYRTLGIPVPRSRIYETATGPVKLSEFREGKTLGELRRTDPAAYEAARQELRKHFVADALLGNWDVIGMNADNILVTPAGEVLRIDNGGALRYRAQGAKKSASQWNGIVDELSTLRQPNVNAAAAAIFGGITDDEIKAQVKAIAGRRAALLKAAPEELREVLGQRIDYLRQFGKPPKAIKVGRWKPTPADRFKTFASTTEADRWIRDANYQKWARELTPAEREAIQHYKNSSYRAINAHFRNKGSAELPDRLRHDVRELDKALARHPTPEPMTTVRYYRLEDAGLTYGQIRPGMDLPDHGYVSTSVNPDHSWGGHRFEVRIPAGVPAGYVQAATPSHQGEYELLLGRGADTFRVVELKTDRHRTIVVELVTPKSGSRKKKGDDG